MAPPARRRAACRRPVAGATLLLLVACVEIGCTSVTRGTWEQLRIESIPPGAAVRLSNGVTGVTPVTFGVRRREDLTVTFTMPGYETVSVRLIPQMDRAGAAGLTGDLLLIPLDGAGLVSAAIDGNSGTFLSHRPNPLPVRLRPVDPRRPDDPPLRPSASGPGHDLETQ